MSAPRHVFEVTIVGSTMAQVEPGLGSVELGDDIVLTSGSGRVRIVADSIHSCELDGGSVTLRSSRGEVIIEPGTGGEAKALAQQVSAMTCTLPEIMGTLQSLGSRRGGPPADHDRFYKPLLHARTAAERASTPRDRVRAFAARQLERSLDEAIAAIALDREAVDAPRRRAMEAHLREFAQPLVQALNQLGDAAEPFSHPQADIVADWRRWSARLVVVVRQADTFWSRARRHLEQYASQRVGARR